MWSVRPWSTSASRLLSNLLTPIIPTDTEKLSQSLQSWSVSIAHKDDLLRAFRNRIIDNFKQEGIHPANMLLLQQQKAADPTAPPAQQPLTSA